MDKREERIESLLKKLNEEQIEFKKEQKEFNEKQMIINKNMYLQNKKSKKNNLFTVFLCLFVSGITSTLAYTIGASSVEYTPRDSNWNVSNAQEAIDNLFDSVGSALVGSVYSYMGVSAPSGYLACDGSTYNIDDYPRLANHINRSFGSYNYFGGDGETTFAVPDLRGEFLRGTGTNSYTKQGSGANVGTHQDATVHTYVTTTNAGNAILIANYINSSNKPIPSNVDSYASSGGKWSQVTSTLGNNVNYEGTYTSRPTNTSVLYIIKY